MIFLRAAAALGLAVLLTACTSSARPGALASFAPSSASSTATAQATPTAAAPPVVAPIAQGAITEHAAPSCPFLAQNFVHYTVGMRLARITVLRDRVRVVGCRFYALQDSHLATTEHLPGPNQPAVEIITQRYPNADAAHNAFVRAADQGANPQQQKLSAAVTAVCYQTAFDPQDKGKDWACGFSRASTAVLIRVAQTDSLDAVLITKKALGAV